MQIRGTSSVQSAQPVRIDNQVNSAQEATSAGRMNPVDQVDISNEASLISQVHQLPEIRAEKVGQLRAQIESGTYETSAKLDAAVERLLDELI